MKHRELTPEAISASTYRDSVHDAITAAIQTAYSQASKSGLMGSPSAEKIKKRFKKEFPAVLKNQLEQGVEPINLVMFSDATWEAAVSPHNQSLIISYKMTDMISDWVASAITYGAKTGAEIVSEVKKPVDYLSGVIVHEIVHLIQQQRQPGKKKDYHSLLKSSADRFISAVQNLASDEDWDLYHASPQEIPAYAHQMIYKMITQALNGEQLRDVPEDEIPYVIQELRDLLRDVATGVNASGDEIGRYLKFKGEDRRRVAVFKRFMKAVYVEVQSYISQLQAGYRGGRPVTESFDSAVEYEWESRSDYEGDAEFYVGDETYHYLYERDPKRESITISFGLGRYSDNLDYGSTGTGNQQIVFAAVIAITRDVLQSFPNTQKLKFSGENSRRQSLYSRIAKTLLPGWKVGRRGTEFTVTKPQEVKESFDSPTEWRWIHRTPRLGTAQFYVGQPNDRVRYVYQYGYQDGSLDIAFAAGDDEDMAITGAGNAQTVFATVVAITREVLSNLVVSEITFTAEEPSRRKLYARLVKTLLPGWSVEQDGRSFRVIKSKPVNETFDQPYPIRKKSQFDRVDYMWTGDDGRRGAAQFRLEDSDMNSWGLIFMVDDVGTGSGTIKQSGGGDAQRIFATVFACLRDWLANEGKDAYGLSFAAARDEPSRVKLYDRFARIMPRFGFEDAHSAFQPHHSKFYEFTRIGMEPPEQHEPELIPPEEQIEEAAIYEVGFSHEVADIDNEQDVIDNSKIDGSISGKDVWRFHNTNIDLTIYFFTDDQESIQAWVMLNGNNLMAMKSYSSGLNFALMHYIIDIKGIRLEIKATDTLTADGLKWIIGQITRRDGFKITDQRNRPIDPDRLKKEWRRAQSQGPGPTAIWIGESAIASNLRLFEASPTHNDRFGIRQGKSEQIEETFDSVKPYRWEQFTPKTGFGYFEVGDTRYEYGYDNTMDSDGNPITSEIGFADYERGYEITGGGHAPEVFGTVIAMTRELLSRYSTIKTLTFSSKEASRTKLYARMAKTLLPGWEMLTGRGWKGETTFSLTRKDGINETLNQPYNWRETESDELGVRYEFHVPGQDKTYEVDFGAKGQGRYVMTFASFDKNDTPQFDITGSGDAFRVFATVADILKRFVNQYKPDLLTFSALESSRIKLYDRLAKMIPKLGFVQQQTIGGRGSYAFKSTQSQPEQDVNESVGVVDIVEYQGIALRLSMDGQNITVTAFPSKEDASNDTNELGFVTFSRDVRSHIADPSLITSNNSLVALQVIVKEKYRGRGIAAKMYDYVKSLGYTIYRSADQTKDGRDFWNKNRNDERVWEDITETFNAPVEAKWLTMGTGNGTANFTVGDVDYQYVYYVKQKSRDGKPLWVWVEFKTAGAKGKYGLTGTGNAAQVLATATQLTRELLDKFPSIYKLIFSAKEKSRQSLYAHMIRRLLPTWETDTKKDRNGLTFTVINNTALAESSLTEIERIPGQDFPIEKTQQILSHCTHDDGDSIDGLKLWMGRNGSERYVILTDDNRNIASYAGFHAIDSHRWQVRNAQTYPGFTGRKLAAKIYKELFDGGVSILSDFQQSSGAEHIWCKNLPAMGVTPMVWDSKSEEIYTADQIGMDKIYSQDPKIMHRYCWILEHHIPSQNLVYEGKMLMPIKGLWYTKRLRFDEMASAGATGSGSVATVAQPLGGVIRRPAIGSSILAGINTAEATPNTPDWMKRYKNRSQNKKRSK